MKAGICGPARLRDLVTVESGWLDVLWGTDDPQSASEHIRTGDAIDTLIVDGNVRFVTSPLIAAATARGIPIVALADAGPNSLWLDDIDGVTRVSAVTEAAAVVGIERTPMVDPAKIDVGSRLRRIATWGRREQPAVLVQREAPATIGVWGPVGAPGATTVAIAIARAAARSGRRVILCDADTRGASIAIALQLVDEIPGFAAASRLAGRGELDVAEINRLSIDVEHSGTTFRVLSGLPRASRWAEIAPSKSLAVISLLVQHWDIVVVDVGFGIEENEWVDGAPQRDGAARALLRACDVVVAVGSPDPIGVARFIRGLDELGEIAVDPVVVLNKTRRHAAGEAEQVIERFSRFPVDVSVAADNRQGVDDVIRLADGAMAGVWEVVRRRLSERAHRDE